MRKIMLGAVALMIGAIGFAQVNDDAQINQVGTSNDGTIAQVGLLNTATIDQFGHNFAVVKQIGDENKADVNQGTDLVHVNNYIWNGWDRGAWIEQLGDRNEATITSQNDGSTGSSGNHNGSSIYQEGDDNIASQILNSFLSERPSNAARKAIEIVQVGDLNKAYQGTRFSFGSHGIQFMSIDQFGDNNFANQFSYGGVSSTMTVVQDGDNNDNATSADVSSTGLSSPLSLTWTGPHAAGMADGTYTQYQNGGRSVATIDILGNDNNTTQVQQYTVWSTLGDNTAEIDIIGDRNAVIQGQLGNFNESDVYISGDDNVVTTGQEGDWNEADVDVMGNLNVGGIMQTGNGHEGIIWQSGDNNFGTITSDGNDHFGSIYQTGNMNEAVITQQNN